ncbi:hypothetical protein QAD02_010801 [Eretmocerus hayati]|uniref:Uncharacterized protein n=1 Tax=Eretmocerus hayati TaxID=131215 RepID=A0ACC2NZP6_9HYME|nr:hypothetical protein QAD02_010801 [Eretmocerus hayati]
MKVTPVITTLISILNLFSGCMAQENGVTTLDTSHQNSYVIVFQDVENFALWRIYCNESTFSNPAIECYLNYLNESSLESNMPAINYFFTVNKKFSSSIIDSAEMKAYRLGDQFLISWLDYTSDTSEHKSVITVETHEYVSVGMYLKFGLISIFNYTDMRQFSIRGAEYHSGIIDHHTLKKNHLIYLYQDSFDVFYVSNKNLEWEQERFSLQPNTLRRRFYGPSREKIYGDTDRIYIANYPNVSIGIIQNHERYRIDQICPDKILCDMKEFDVARKSWSTANDFVTSCEKISSNVWKCFSQFNSNDSSNFNMTFPFEPTQFMVSNLPNKLVLSVTTQQNSTSEIVIQMTAFAIDGTRYASVEFHKLNNVATDIAGIAFQEEHQKVCLSMLWKDNTHHYNEINCYPRHCLTQDPQSSGKQRKSCSR